MVTRRSVLAGALTVAGTGLVGACRSEPAVAPDGPQVRDAEAARMPGPVREFRLDAVPAEVDLGGRVVRTWTYGGRIPGTAIRVNVGEQVRAVVSNGLPVETSVHWHGVALRNDADGVPHVTQAPIRPGERFTYQFTAAHPGTYWLHPHSGVQLDRGLYAPLIVDDPNEPVSYDDEWIVVLDDWLDGVTGTPEDTFDSLRGRMGHMMGGARQTSRLLGGDAGDVTYPYHLVNGRLPVDPAVYRGRPGERVRLRVVNAAADTVFRMALGGHRMRVTHADGYPVVPVEVEALLIGMGERYDVVVTLGDGVFPLVALAEGKDATGYAIVRTASGQAPPASVRPGELEGRLLGYEALMPDPSVMLAGRVPDRVIRLVLTGGMMGYDWRINGERFDHTTVSHLVAASERIRIDYANDTMMFHPMHLHGHTFAVGSASGPRKDTVMILPGQTLSTFLDADNPGRWMIHCHNAYHAEAGMMTLLGYRQ